MALLAASVFSSAQMAKRRGCFVVGDFSTSSFGVWMLSAGAVVFFFFRFSLLSPIPPVTFWGSVRLFATHCCTALLLCCGTQHRDVHGPAHSLTAVGQDNNKVRHRVGASYHVYLWMSCRRVGRQELCSTCPIYGTFSVVQISSSHL